MTNYDTYFFAIAFMFGIVLFGVFMGYTMDYANNKKDPITAMLDGWLIVFPMICMIGLLSPVITGIWSIFFLVYSLGKFILGEFVWDDYNTFAFFYCCLMVFILLWVWFRREILNYKDII